MTVSKDEFKVHLRTDCSKAVLALDNCMMAGAFMPLQRAIWLEIRSESLKENARSWTVAHLSCPDLRISADSPRIGRSGTHGGTIRTSGRGTDCGSPRIARDPRETSGNSRPDWPPWVLRNSPANRTDDLYSHLPSDWLQRKSLARKIRSLVGHAVPSTRLPLRRRLQPDARC